MINLPSSAFRALRASKMLSRNIGWRLISEQVDNAVDKSEEVDLSPILSGGALRAITDGLYPHIDHEWEFEAAALAPLRQPFLQLRYSPAHGYRSGPPATDNVEQKEGTFTSRALRLNGRSPGDGRPTVTDRCDELRLL
ncbi:hypothetical protein R3P38DRAFT_3231358 [Favolaschia claudopus]|uniref:Uncharacterized protein n=1 Tax=Favolaschia claudopus TaxID=2862362 RepID=A0AAV9ZKG0_9AGAR